MASWEDEIKNSNPVLPDLDKIVELIYRNCDCSLCKITGVECPFAHYTDADEFKEDDYLTCKKIFKETILKAAGESEKGKIIDSKEKIN